MGDKRRRTYCCVFGCLNSSSIPQLSLFRLPTEQERRLQWLRLIDREDLINKSHFTHVVCEIHFHPEDIVKKSVRKLLKKNCLPRLNLPNIKPTDKHTQVEITSCNNSSQTETTSVTSACQTDIKKSDNITQTTAALSASIPFCKKLKSELSDCKKRLRAIESEKYSLDMFHKLCDRFLSNNLAEFVKAQTYLEKKRRKKGTNIMSLTS